RYGTRQIHGRARHPQSQGQIERANQTLKRKLRAAVTITAAPERWIDCLHGAVAGYNRCVHKTTRAQPIRLFWGISESITGPEEELLLDEEEGEERQRDLEPEEDPLDILGMLSAEPEIYTAARENSQRAYRRMSRAASWNRDEDVFQNGDRVVLERDFDANKTTKKRALTSS
ncbi:MAG: uncharacterized protein A8A55_3535, partial [Amphiamblys sp. WSBS2006]